MTPELSQYKSSGFYVAKALLDESSIDSVRRSLLKTLSDQLARLSIAPRDASFLGALSALHSSDIERYKKVLGALWRKHDVYKLMHDDRITGFLGDKFGFKDLFVPGGQVVHVMAHELKIPNGYFGLIPHQDFPSVQGSLDGVVVWLPLVDVDRDNFPLELIPGSHRRGMLPMIDHGESTREVRPDLYNEGDFVPAEVEVGDVIFMSMFTIHRSSVTGSPGRCRLAISTRFDNADEPTFVDRAYPTAYVRSVRREQYYDGFPTVAQVAKAFGQ